MRCDDDNKWGGGCMHGLYEVSCAYGDYGGDIKGEIMKKNVIIKDFMKFVILAHDNHGYPKDEAKFSIKKMLEIAPPLLERWFTKECAIKLYGEENVFSKKPSLRRQAEYIYKTSIGQEHNVGKEAYLNYQEVIEDKIEESVDSKNFENSHFEIFEPIGGKDAWVKLYRELDMTRVYNKNDPKRQQDIAHNYPDGNWVQKQLMIPERLRNASPEELIGLNQAMRDANVQDCRIM